MPKFDINEFLYEEENHDLYERFLSNREWGLNEVPLEKLLAILVDNVSYAKGNRQKPLEVSLNIKEVAESLPIEPREEFYVGLLEILCREYEESLIPCIRMINRDYKKYEEEFQNLMPFGYELEKTADWYLKEYEMFKDGHIKYLGEIGPTRYNSWFLSKNLKKQESVDAASTTEPEINKDPLPNTVGKDGLTERQQAIFFNLLKECYKLGEGMPNTTYANVVGKVLNKRIPPVMTTFNIYKFLNNPESGFTSHENSISSAIKDYTVIKDLFSSIRATEIVKIIDLKISKLKNGLE